MAEGFWRQTSDNKLVASAYSEMTAPTGHDFVLTSTIEAAYSGEIWQDGTWDGTEYKPPTNIIVPYDAGTDGGAGADRGCTHVGRARGRCRLHP